MEIETGDGEVLDVVYDEDDVRLLLATEPEIHRGRAWTKGEIRALVTVGDDHEVFAEIRRLKRTIPGLNLRGKWDRRRTPGVAMPAPSEMSVGY